MQHQHRSRVTIILIVVFVAIFGIPGVGGAITSLSQLFNTNIPWSKKFNLKPGIDIAGGTSLVYEIKAPPGNTDPDLSMKVASSLKKRVDPNGVQNLVWRPQGPTRLEIQMPLSANSDQNKIARKEFAKAQAELVATNFTAEEIKAALNLSPEQRPEAFARIANGSPVRLDNLNQLAAVHDDLAKAVAARDLSKQVDLEPRHETLLHELTKSNIVVDSLGATLQGFAGDLEKAKKQNKGVAELQNARQKFIDEYLNIAKDYKKRTDALNGFVRAYESYLQTKGAVDDAEDLKKLLQGSGVLEFHILVSEADLLDKSKSDVQAMIARLHEQNGEPPKGVLPMKNDTMRWYEVENKDEVKGRASQEYLNKTWILCYINADESMTHKENAIPWGLEEAHGETQPTTGETVVAFKFDTQGGNLFGELSGRHIGQALGIVLDEKLISAPNLQSRIQGAGIITGQRSRKEREYLISTLNAGSLPASLASDPISERTVSPQIGGDNLRAGLYACVLGLVVVCIFMMFYYHLSGIIASTAVLLNMILILGVLAMFQATFTLPGIAALVLTVGTSVDANVLIFERLREEQHRGLSLRMAVHNAYDRAFSAILDSNVITIIVSVVLYGFGSEEVKGFGLTLLIGIITSLLTALFVTRTIFDILIDLYGLKKLGSFPLSYPKWEQFLRPNIDWMGKAWIFYVMSSVIIITGLSAFFFRTRDMFDIEFVSGTAVEFELKPEAAMPLPAVRALLEKPEYEKAIPAAQVVAISGSGESNRIYEVITTNGDSNQVKDAIMRAIGDKLNLERPSTFTLTDAKVQDLKDKAEDSFNDAQGKAWFKVNDLKNAGLTFTPKNAANIQSGVSIVLRNLDPPMTPKNILDRVERARLQADPSYREVKIDANTAEDVPTTTAVVTISSDPSSDQDKWVEETAKPAWKYVTEAIRRPPALQKVTNFSPQVASDMTRDAMMALGISIGLVMIYIWLRFGNFKFGTATVVAMLHDVLIAIGGIGLTHYAADHIPALAKILLIEPFRVNLTLVAAVLTVMAYSMIDTIVVFDRIRENRGKFGHLDRQLINDSVNQTLSRTLLTAGTTLSTIFVMYVFGGAAIHGFTFVLLIGILVGTYSSIAIAAPLLLIGKQAVVEGMKPPALRRIQRAAS